MDSNNRDEKEEEEEGHERRSNSQKINFQGKCIFP